MNKYHHDNRSDVNLSITSWVVMSAKRSLLDEKGP